MWLRVLIFVGVLVLFQNLIDRLRDRQFWTWLRRLGWAVASLILIVAYPAYTDHVVRNVVMSPAARPDLFPPAAPKRMRRDVAKVITHLEHRIRQGRQTGARAKDDVPMLLTNDNMILTWWAVMGKGSLLLPDVFSVTLTQETIERKLAQAGRVWGFDEDTFVALLIDGAFNNLFYGHNQYQTSIIWHPAPLSDYPAGVRRDLKERNTAVWTNYRTAWRLVLPMSRREQLREFYKSYVLDEDLLPDYVVVSRYKHFPRDLVLPDDYRLTLETRNYLVWIRQR